MNFRLKLFRLSFLAIILYGCTDWVLPNNCDSELKILVNRIDNEIVEFEIEVESGNWIVLDSDRRVILRDSSSGKLLVNQYTIPNGIFIVSVDGKRSCGFSFQETISFENTNSKIPEMIFIEEATFRRNTALTCIGPCSVPVYISSFFISKYEVTKDQFVFFLNNSVFKSGFYTSGDSLIDANNPAQASWLEATIYCNKLSSVQGFTPVYEYKTEQDSLIVNINFEADGFRLPTTAEWEYAAINSKELVYWQYYSGAGGNDSTPDLVTSYANFKDEDYDNYNDGFRVSSPVGSFLPNGFGIYDMSGNVAEWCQDWYDESKVWRPNLVELENPRGPESGKLKTYMGGHFWTPLNELSPISYPYDKSQTSRKGGEPVGFNPWPVGIRLVRSASK